MIDIDPLQREHFCVLAEKLVKLLQNILEKKENIDSDDNYDSAFNFVDHSPRKGEINPENITLIRNTRPPLPHPALVRQLIRQRRARERYFDSALFSDPAWDILLDLTIARAEHSRVSVTSLCIASSVPPTTALRWIKEMVNNGLLKRTKDQSDRRRVFVELTDSAANAMADLFHEIQWP